MEQGKRMQRNQERELSVFKKILEYDYFFQILFL